MHYFIMKTPNKQKLQQITLFNHSSDIDLRDFLDFYKKCTAKPYSFSVIDAILVSDNPKRSRKNLFERIKILIMTIDDKLRDEKLQYDITKKVAKISALSSGKIEYLTGEEILPSNQRQMIEQAMFAHSP